MFNFDTEQEVGFEPAASTLVISEYYACKFFPLNHILKECWVGLTKGYRGFIFSPPGNSELK